MIIPINLKARFNKSQLKKAYHFNLNKTTHLQLHVYHSYIGLYKKNPLLSASPDEKKKNHLKNRKNVI